MHGTVHVGVQTPVSSMCVLRVKIVSCSIVQLTSVAHSTRVSLGSALGSAAAQRVSVMHSSPPALQCQCSSLHSISRVSLVDYTGPTVTAGAARYGYTAVHQCSQCQPSSLHCSAECRSRGPTWSAFVQCRLHCLHLGMLRLHTCDRVVTPRIILTISRN